MPPPPKVLERPELKRLQPKRSPSQLRLPFRKQPDLRATPRPMQFTRERVRNILHSMNNAMTSALGFAQVIAMESSAHSTDAGALHKMGLTLNSQLQTFRANVLRENEYNPAQHTSTIGTIRLTASTLVAKAEELERKLGQNSSARSALFGCKRTLYWANMLHSGTPGKKQPIELRSTIEAALLNFGNITHGITVKYVAPDREIHLVANQIVLHDILENLILNAVEHGSKGKIVVRLSQNQHTGEAEFSVTTHTKPLSQVALQSLGMGRFTTKGEDQAHGHGVKSIAENVKTFGGSLHIFNDAGNHPVFAVRFRSAERGLEASV